MEKIILLKRKYLCETISTTLVLLIGYLDFITGYEICFSLFYLIPITIISICKNYIWGLIFSAIATIVWITGEIANGMTFSHYSIPYWNSLMRFGFYSIISIFADKSQKSFKKETEISKFKSDMISAVSHEFNNLLTGLNLTAILLEEGEQPKIEEERINLYKMHRHNYTAMSEQIKILLNNSRLESGKITPKLKKAKIRDIINNAINYLLPIAYKKNIKIKKHFPKENIPINCDIDLMNLAISNLIANAIKYSPIDKNISVYIKQINNTKMEVSIEDNGIGIKKEDFDKIFSGYYRTEESMRYASGFGIGLKLTKDIIELHNSELKLESKMGQGSKFSFTLPISQ